MTAPVTPHQSQATIRYVVKGERSIFYPSDRDKSYWPADDHEMTLTDLRPLQQQPMARMWITVAPPLKTRCGAR